MSESIPGHLRTFRAGLFSPSSSPLNSAPSSSAPSPSFLSLPRRFFRGSASTSLPPPVSGRGRPRDRFVFFCCSFSSSLSFDSRVHLSASSRARLRCSASSSACCRIFSSRSRLEPTVEQAISVSDHGNTHLELILLLFLLLSLPPRLLQLSQ